jgi:multiple sugar transport system permease protein
MTRALRLRRGAPNAADLALLVALAVIVLPIAWMTLAAFRQPRDLIEPGVPITFTFSNFHDLFAAGSTFTHQALNSLEIVVGTTVLCTVIGSLGGYSLSQMSWRRSAVALVVSVIGLIQLAPPITLVPGEYVTLSQFGLLGTVRGLILLNTMFVLPIATLLMKVYFDGLPVELRESGLVDGASEFMVFRRIMLPLAAPGLAVVTIFTAILAWNEFLFGLTMSKGASSAPLTVWIATVVQSYSIQWTDLAAAGVISSVPIILIAVFANRFVVSGLTAGAVKQ